MDVVGCARGPLSLPIVGCARCHGEGHDLTFEPLTHPVETAKVTFTHWAPCPENGQPILLSLNAGGGQ